MEKYSQWRDNGTGIQPFLPPVPSSTLVQGPVYLLKAYLLGPVFFLLRLPFVLVSFLLFGLAQVVSLILPVPVVRRPIHRALTALAARLLLLTFGAWSIGSQTVSLRKGRSVGKGGPKTAPVNSGDIILSNHSSYIDILYFVFRYDPLFVQSFADGDSVVVQSAWSAFAQCGAAPQTTPREARPLSEVVEEARKGRRGPVIVFPEGTTSNGRAILKFTPVLKAVDPAQRKDHGAVHALILKYTYSIACPSYTVGGLWKHVAYLLMQPSLDLSVRRVSAEDLSQDPTPSEAYGERMARVMASAGKVRACGLGSKEKASFIQYYQKMYAS